MHCWCCQFGHACVCRLVCSSVTFVRYVTMVITNDDVKLTKAFRPSTHQFTAATAGDQTTELYIPSPLKNNTGRFLLCLILFCFKWFDERDLHNAFRTLTTLSVWAQRTQNSHHAGTFGCAPSASSASRAVPPHRAKATTPPGPMTFPSASSVANSWTKVSH